MGQIIDQLEIRGLQEQKNISDQKERFNVRKNWFEQNDNKIRGIEICVEVKVQKVRLLTKSSTVIWE